MDILSTDQMSFAIGLVGGNCRLGILKGVKLI